MLSARFPNLILRQAQHEVQLMVSALRPDLILSLTKDEVGTPPAA